MYLIGNNGYRIFFAEATYLCELLARPDSADGVMGIAENHKRGLPVRELLFKVGNIDTVSAGADYGGGD